MVQYLRIHLPTQGTWVQSLVQEDPTCCRATKAHLPQLLSQCSWACELPTTEPMSPRACALKQEKPPQWEARILQWRLAPGSPQLEKARAQQKRPNTAKRKNKTKLSVHFSCSVLFNSLQPHSLQHARLPCPSLSPRVCSNSCPLRRWCHPTVSSSVAQSVLQ